jgi:hypothetical protein
MILFPTQLPNMHERQGENNMKRIILTAVTTFVLVSLTACQSNTKEPDMSLGSAGELEGNTLIISVFANDVNYKWDLASETDQSSMENIDSYLGIAADFLSETAFSYGKKATFTYDFIKNKKLCYYAYFDIDAAQSDSWDAEIAMNTFIDENIDADYLRKKYKADNIIYFMFLNTDDKSDGYACTRNWYEGMEYPYEIVFMYNVDTEHINCPAVYAHEMLHAFGALDLYYEDAEYGISSEFLNYISENVPNDIMYYCSDPETGEYLYDSIPSVVSEVDAYYVGLTDYSELVEEYHLGKSQH